MLFISHSGKLNGVNTNLENKPSYILKALEKNLMLGQTYVKAMWQLIDKIHDKEYEQAISKWGFIK